MPSIANKQNKQRYPYYAKTGKGTINRHTSLSCQCRDDMLLIVQGYVTALAQRNAMSNGCIFKIREVGAVRVLGG